MTPGDIYKSTILSMPGIYNVWRLYKTIIGRANNTNTNVSMRPIRQQDAPKPQYENFESW